MGCTASNASSSAVAQPNKPQELKTPASAAASVQTKQPGAAGSQQQNQKPIAPAAASATASVAEKKADEPAKTMGAKRPSLSLTPPPKNIHASSNEDEEIKKILEKTNFTELDDEEDHVPKGVAGAKKYDLQEFFKLPSISAILDDKISTKDKLLELFDILDDDKDGLLSEIEIDDIVYLVKTSHQEKQNPSDSKNSRQSMAVADGPIMSEGIQIDYKHKHHLESSNANAAPQKVVHHQDADEFEYGATNITERFSMNLAKKNSQQNVQKPPVEPPAEPVPAGLAPVETAAASAVSPNSGPSPQKRKPTVKKFITPTPTPETASPQKIAMIRTPSHQDSSLSRNMMSDFAEESADQNRSSDHITINDGDHSKKVIKKRASHEDVVEFVGPVPPAKKGFLIASPSKESLYHVLDTGVLYCIDSNSKSPMSFSLDRKGVPLRGRSLVVRQDNVLELTPPVPGSSPTKPPQVPVEPENPFLEENEKIELRPRNEREKKDWIKAIEEHIQFMDRQPEGILPGHQQE